MIEQGSVLRVEDELAEILIDSKPECAKCDACIYFSPTKRKVIALNKVGAKLHDRVEVYISPLSRIKAGFLTYLLPVLFFFGAYLIYSIYLYKFFEHKPSELLSAVAGFIGIFLAFIILRLYQKFIAANKIEKNYIIRAM